MFSQHSYYSVPKFAVILLVLLVLVQCSCKYLAAFLQKSVCFECGQEATNPLFKMYSRRACRALNVQLTFLSVTNRTGTCVHIYYTMLTWSEPRPLMHSVKIGEMTGFKKQQQQQQQQQKNAGRWNWIDRYFWYESQESTGNFQFGRLLGERHVYKYGYWLVRLWYEVLPFIIDC